MQSEKQIAPRTQPESGMRLQAWRCDAGRTPAGRRRLGVITRLAAVSLALTLLNLAAGAFGTPVTVTIEPPAQAVIPGSSFCLNVTVHNVTNLGADQATLHFDPQMMQVAQITEGAFLSSAGTTLGAGWEIVNNSAGALTFFYALTTFGLGVNGSGTLASILFTTESSTNATAPVNLADILLVDAVGSVIPVEVIANATVTVGTPAHTVFDTGRGSYPSIAGRHNGTIMPYSTLTVSRLYTYPCSGTAGHAEYARLATENGSWSVESVPWPGYSGEWHYLYFPQPVTLHANVTYHYTLRTASYPELVHLPLKETAQGTITCSEFVDANGNTRSGWIPAVRLE